jgi:hypothetical protein
VQALHRKICEFTGHDENLQWYVPVGYVAKSGSLVTYFYKKQNDIQGARFIAAADFREKLSDEQTPIVFLDDYIGSGHQATEFWKTVIEPIGSHESRSNLIFGSLVGYTRGIEQLRQSTGFTPIVVDVLADADRPFSDSSSLFPDPKEREHARSVVEKYGSRLYPNHPYGYADSQSLVGFFYSTPNNTLPIFWSPRQNWQPLLPRAEVFRDGTDLVGPTKGIGKEPSTSLLFSQVISDSDLDDIPQAMTDLLSGEFKALGVVVQLALVFKQLGISIQVATGLIELIQGFKYLQHEKEYVQSSVLLVTTRAALGSAVFARAVGEVTVNSLAEVQSLAQLVDAYEGTLVVEADGKVVGDIIYPQPEKPDDYRTLPDRYQAAAHISYQSGGLLFLFGGAGRVSVFYHGRRILLHRASTWHRSGIEPREISKLAEQHDMSTVVLEHVLLLAVKLSDAGSGTLITVGDHEGVLLNSDPPKASYVSWAEMSLQGTPDAAILPLLRQDGATVISGDGKIIRAMTRLSPPAVTKATEEIGRGTKHSTAAKISKVTKALVVAVSTDDGRVAIFSDGNIVLKRMG